MSFDIYRIRTLSPDRYALERQGSLALGGPQGIFATHLPELAKLNEQWSVTPETLLKWAGVDDVASHGIFFDLTPQAKDQVNLFALVRVSGRTVSLLTDVLFHFKVACASRNPAEVTGPGGERILHDWKDGRNRLESLRISGGTRGGAWAWSEPPQSASATVL